MKIYLNKSRKGPVIYTDPCFASPISKAVDVIQTVAIIAAFIFSMARR